MSRKTPVFLEPSKSRKIIVFGGGMVAFRKCRQFEGFDITVVADKVVEGMDSVCDRILPKHFEPTDISEFLEGAFIAVAATDSKNLNAAITESAKKNGVLVNSAHGGGDILLPSTIRKENYTVAISSEGSVPAFPPYVAKQIDSFLGPEYDLMMVLLTYLRKDLQSVVSQQPKRAEFLAEVLADDAIWHMLKTNDMDSAIKAAQAIEEKYCDQ